MKIALLGAESTGKTRLASELGAQLRRQGKSVAVVPEVLRGWVVRAGREPRPEEQMPIAREQERRVDEAAATNAIVIADTTALMVAIYSGMLFEDGELYRFALQQQRRYDIALVLGLDLPWLPDGLQRAGPQLREPVDMLVRKALADIGAAYRVVYGQGQERLENGLAAIDSVASISQLAAAGRRWQWNCEKCGDPQCEHRLFTQLKG
ncbi:MAG: ATP-binding protein [Ramlibacter sp.]|nr:ATP-binding protein [Ramlibacter sp.]